MIAMTITVMIERMSPTLANELPTLSRLRDFTPKMMPGILSATAMINPRYAKPSSISKYV